MRCSPKNWSTKKTNEPERKENRIPKRAAIYSGARQPKNWHGNVDVSRTCGRGREESRGGKTISLNSVDTHVRKGQHQIGLGGISENIKRNSGEGGGGREADQEKFAILCLYRE